MSRTCPHCPDAPALSAMPVGAAELDFCSACRGLFVDGEEWSRVFGADLAPGEAAARQRGLACPACASRPGAGDAGRLVSRRVRDAEGLIVDRCERCGGTWLDSGEMAAVREHLRGAGSVAARGAGEAWSERAEAEGGETTESIPPGAPVPGDIRDITRPDPKYWRMVLIQAAIGTVATLGLLLPLVAIGLLPAWFRYRTMRYEFDEEGVGVSWGVLFQQSTHVTYARFQDIHLNRGLLERWLGLGTVEVQTASGSSSAEISLFGLTRFDEVRDYLYSRMRGAKGREVDDAGEPASREAEALALLRDVRAEVARLRASVDRIAGGGAVGGASTGRAPAGPDPEGRPAGPDRGSS